MVFNYIKIAWRRLSQNKTLSLIKILGLSIGLMVCMLIFLYTKDEISYDQFHANKTHIYRITQDWQIGNNPKETMSITNAILGESFAKEIPGIEQYVRINGEAVTVKKDNEVFAENPLFVDDNFFSMFSFPLLEGNPSSALKDLHSVVLTKNMANKYFGTTDIIGKIIQIKLNDQFEGFKVTAVAENPPQNSSIKIDILLPYTYFENFNSNKGWFGGSVNTFIMLSPQADLPRIQAKMQAMFVANTKDQLEQTKKQQGEAVSITLGLQKLTDIHLSTEAGPDNGMTDGSSPMYSYMLTCIAIFILIIACINFINIAVAQSLKRSKEIGIRKVVGSSRGQLIKQFLVESFIISLIAFAMALFLTVVILPFFNELANKKLSLSYLTDWSLYTGYFLLLLATAFISGFYPSLVLSAFQPVKVLYNRQKLMGKNYLTRSLIVVQFVMAIFLIIGTIALNTQLNFVLHTDLGYDSKNLVAMDVPVSKASDKLPAIFKNELANKDNILGVAARNKGRNISGVKAEGKNIFIELNKIDDKYLPTFKIPFVAGRNFSPSYPSDTLHSAIVNESFIKEAGWSLPSAVGKTIISSGGKPLTVIGVIKDYHFSSLKEKISAAMFSMDPDFNYGQIWVKIDPKNIPQTLALLEKTFKKILPYFPYTYQFKEESNAKNYETELKWKQIILIASLLFIFISCMGLFGLVVLSIEQRTKEIGIRKVLGAAISTIVFLISKEFILLISIAFIIAVPLSYYAIHKWLQDFAYRINIGWWMFALAALLIIFIAMVTMSFQAIKAAVTSPVKSLRTD
jgi:putative ABC transport system permease protein